MPFPFSDEDLDGLLSGNNPEEVEYESVLDADDDDTSIVVPATPGATPAGQPAAGQSADLSQFLQQDLQFRQEQARQAAEQERIRNAAAAKQRQEEARAQRQQEIDARLAQVLPDAQAPTLTDEERATFQQSLPMIERMAAYHAQRQTAQLRDTFRDVLLRNAELEDQIAEVRTTTQADPRQQLDLMVRAQIPDIDATLGDKDWTAFRDQVIPALGMTAGQVIQHHYQSGNAQGVVQVINSFRNRKKTTRTESPTPVPSASGPSSRPTGGKMLRYSELNEAYARNQAGTLAYDKLQVIVNKFEDAAARGRVDYDK